MCNFVITGVAVFRALGSEAFISYINSVLFAISLLISLVVIIYNFIYRVVDLFCCFSFTLEIYCIATWPPVEPVGSFFSSKMCLTDLSLLPVCFHFPFDFSTKLTNDCSWSSVPSHLICSLYLPFVFLPFRYLSRLLVHLTSPVFSVESCSSIFIGLDFSVESDSYSHCVCWIT